MHTMVSFMEAKIAVATVSGRAYYFIVNELKVMARCGGVR